MKSKEKITKYLNQHLSKNITYSRKQKEDMKKYVEMLNEKPLEKDYINIEEQFNKMREVYYGDILSQMHWENLWDNLKLKPLMFWAKVMGFFNRFKRKR